MEKGRSAGLNPGAVWSCLGRLLGSSVALWLCPARATAACHAFKSPAQKRGPEGLLIHRPHQKPGDVGLSRQALQSGAGHSAAVHPAMLKAPRVQQKPQDLSPVI